jgi:hypothetical protein
VTGAGLVMRRSDPADAGAIASLMNSAFGGDDQRVTLDPEWWHWKYGSNPAGYQGLVAQDREGRVVGHFGGVPMEVCVDGQVLTFAQSCDACSDRSTRRGLGNPGLFARLAQAYTSTFGLPGCNALMYGLPNKSVYRIGSRYSDYWMLRQQWLLVSKGGSPPAADPSVVISEATSFGDEVTALHQALAPRYRCMARRDARFLNWRFRDAPGASYVVSLARDSVDGTLRAYAVHRPARLMGHDVGLLMDWLCDPEDQAAAHAVQGAVQRFHRRRGRDAVAFLCPPSSPWFDAFQRSGFQVLPSPYMMTARPFVQQLEPRFLRDHWYYTLADFDIF